MLASKHKWTNNGFSKEEFILFLYHTQKNQGEKKDNTTYERYAAT